MGKRRKAPNRQQAIIDRIVAKSPGFEPTPRQAQARARAVHVWAALTSKLDERPSGLPRQFSVGAFIRHAGAGFSPRLQLSEWNEWDAQPGFTQWFMSAFPDLERATLTDLHILEGAFMQGVIRQVQEGSPAGLRLYSQIRQEARAGSKGASGAAGDRQGLEDFLAASGGSPWLDDLPEA